MKMTKKKKKRKRKKWPEKFEKKMQLKLREKVEFTKVLGKGEKILEKIEFQKEKFAKKIREIPE